MGGLLLLKGSMIGPTTLSSACYRGRIDRTNRMGGEQSFDVRVICETYSKKAERD